MDHGLRAGPSFSTSVTGSVRPAIDRPRIWPYHSSRSAARRPWAMLHEPIAMGPKGGVCRPGILALPELAADILGERVRVDHASIPRSGGEVVRHVRGRQPPGVDEAPGDGDEIVGRSRTDRADPTP